MSQTHRSLDRRKFILGVAAGLISAPVLAQPSGDGTKTASERLAVLGGEKTVRKSPKPPVRFGEPERRRLTATMEQSSLFYWKGPQTDALIERFRILCPQKYVQTCSSGTAALHVAVAAAGIGPGDEVITSPFTDVGTVIGVLFQQGVPVFADLLPNTYNLNPEDVERRITPKTKAIIAVHLWGNPCDMDSLRKIANRHQLILIEDCAQAWGARYRGAPIGTMGDIACFSLQDSKQITAGEGGIVSSNSERIGPLLQPFADKGKDRQKNASILFHALATNYRMSEPQAAVAAAQLERVEQIAEKRARLGAALSEQIAGIRGVMPHLVAKEDRCTYWSYYLRIEPEAFRVKRVDFVKALVAEGVFCGGGYISALLHKNPMFMNHAFFAGRWPIKEMGLTAIDYSKHETPEAEKIKQQGIRITLHEAMEEDYISDIARSVKKVARNYAI